MLIAICLVIMTICTLLICVTLISALGYMVTKNGDFYEQNLDEDET